MSASAMMEKNAGVEPLIAVVAGMRAGGTGRARPVRENRDVVRVRYAGGKLGGGVSMAVREWETRVAILGRVRRTCTVFLFSFSFSSVSLVLVASGGFTSAEMASRVQPATTLMRSLPASAAASPGSESVEATPLGSTPRIMTSAFCTAGMLAPREMESFPDVRCAEKAVFKRDSEVSD